MALHYARPGGSKGGEILAKLVMFRVFVGTWRRNFVPKCTCWALGKLAATFLLFYIVTQRTLVLL